MAWNDLNDNADNWNISRSGAACQRISLARSCIPSSHIMLLDALVSSLGDIAKQRPLKLLVRLKQQIMRPLIRSDEARRFLEPCINQYNLIQGKLATDTPGNPGTINIFELEQFFVVTP
jgi:ABC-type polar amino acid transport system ATPase subunit